MKSLLIVLQCWIAISALPADRWPNVLTSESKRDLVVISPTSDYVTPHYHDLSANKEALFTPAHSYTPLDHDLPKYPPAYVVKKPHYNEKELRKAYNNYLDNTTKLKKRIIQSAVDKTVDVTAKLAQYTVDFMSRLAIETAAKIAKNGANNVIHKKEHKFYAPSHH